MIRHLPPPRLQRLPLTLAPLHRETWDSYVGRLAAVNRISHLVVHEHINNQHRIHPAPLPLLDAISNLSGHPRDRLLKALPDLRAPGLTNNLPRSCQLLDDGWQVQAACTLCLAAKGVFAQARHWVPKSTRLCLRHGRWTDTYHAQFDLRRLPEILQAQRDHHRLVREHGWQTVVIAMRQATAWCWRWWDSRRFHQRRDRRLKVLIPPGGGTFREDPRLIASSYPDIVALTGLLASPQLRSLPFTGNDRDFRLFISEVRARAAPGYRYEAAGVADPLVRWIEEERYYRTLPNHPWPMPNEPRTHNPETPEQLVRRLNEFLDPGSEDPGRCANCGNHMKAENPRMRFCSTACRSRNWRLQQHERTLREASSRLEKRECPACGVTWTPGNDRRRDARYCSHRCRQAAFRRRTAVENS
ncbi:TniQ family protein [Streptomyces sp. H10-C2]|uniref:TniQ family protein n=1 Tax=unclassified Streptomyces TaxID=2593676 RepID=UPI0024B8CB72|nr:MULTISPECIES: TniQ family protein [unclassified Streptomyces]MDJ0342140.1 TniQ family protein [Streptomyces sp. PH10-H1]MDJ0368654.1 TniQ family protein [Streptomyces sp. H10-C2]